MNEKKNRPIKRKKSGNEKKIGFLTYVLLGFLLLGAGYLIYNKFIKKDSHIVKGIKELSSFKFVKQGELSFADENGIYKVGIDIEIADTDEKRTLGLMHRSSMEEKQGMLFIFPMEEFQSFWMKNTMISLDIIFVDSKGEIITIHENTETYSQKSYPSEKPSQYVVEVIAGFTAKYKIKKGDKIIWRRI